MEQTITGKNLPIAIGSDHAGFHYKEAIIKMLSEGGIKVLDKGAYSEQSVDYPDHAHPVAAMVNNGEAAWGVLICGSGNGVCMTANKHKNVRAALCWNEELSSLARLHNNANILCIPARFIELEIALQMVKTFQNTAFEGGRHTKRIEKINPI